MLWVNTLSLRILKPYWMGFKCAKKGRALPLHEPPLNVIASESFFFMISVYLSLYLWRDLTVMPSFPPIEEVVVAHLCPSSRGWKSTLPSKPCRATANIKENFMTSPCHEISVSVNVQKSRLQPSQTISFLGIEMESSNQFSHHVQAMGDRHPWSALKRHWG